MKKDKEIVLEMTIAASPQEVFKALTDGEQLTHWFTEYAEVSLEDSRYNFWGRMTPEAAEENQGRQRLLGFAPNRNLKFEWSLRGTQTTVFVDLKEQGGRTHLRLSHLGVPTIKPGQFAVADFWNISLENLRHWVEARSVGASCDFLSIPKGTAKVQVEVDASPEQVFDALINPEQLKRYIGENPVVEPEAGGRMDFGWEEGGPVKILEIEPSKKLSYDWRYANEPDTVVTWTLEGSGGKTRLTLVHSGFAPDRSLEDYVVGWLSFLNRIKFMVEGGERWEKVKITSHEF